jgi:hypothetical protein
LLEEVGRLGVLLLQGVYVRGLAAAGISESFFKGCSGGSLFVRTCWLLYRCRIVLYCRLVLVVWLWFGCSKVVVVIGGWQLAVVVVGGFCCWLL